MLHAADDSKSGKQLVATPGIQKLPDLPRVTSTTIKTQQMSLPSFFCDFEESTPLKTNMTLENPHF